MRLHRTQVSLPIIAIALAATLPACQGDITQLVPANASTNGNATPLTPFVGLTAHAYATKVKTILTGEALSATELAQLTTDPNSLKSMIVAWQQTPSYQTKMIRFLGNAFEQLDPVASDFAAQGVAIDAGTLGSTSMSALLVGNLQQEMARTVLNADASGQPFKAAMSGSTFMLTPPLAAYYTYLDNVSINDAGQMVSTPSQSFASILANFTPQDFNSWRPVSIVQPEGSQTPTGLTDTTTFKTGTQLVLNTPRVGFFTTPAFFAQWPTNATNQARVTMNQTLIVALGHAFDGSESIQPLSLAALDQNHAVPGSACYGCHLDLDPMRQFFRQAYTISFSKQTDPNEIALPGMFAFDGVSVAGKSIFDLGTQLANHPSLPAAWVQKLCTYANDAVCDTTDPEFVRITADFAQSQSFSALVVDLFSSPIVTDSARTVTTDANAPVFPVTKTDHLCALLSTRLGINDVCSQSPGAAPQGSMATLQLIASILPADGYSRGQTKPVLANSPTLFFRSGMENVCAILAAQVVDSGSSPLYSSSDPNTAVTNMVGGLMGVEKARAAAPEALLITHYNAAVASGASPTSALQSTFMAACLSPGVVGIGQ